MKIKKIFENLINNNVISFKSKKSRKVIIPDTELMILNILSKGKKNKDNNLCFSPAGLCNLMSMILPAISGNTKNEVLKRFDNKVKNINYISNNKNDVRIISYNYLVYNDNNSLFKIKKKYSKYVKSFNDGSDIYLYSKNRDKTKMVNDIKNKVKRITNDKLTPIIELNEYNDEFVIEYTNVIYFIAKWSKNIKYNIVKQKFKNYDKTKTNTDFIVFNGNSAKYIVNKDFEGCKISYNHKKNRYSFYALLPKDEEFDIENFCFDNLCEINELYKLNVRLPKYKIETEQDYISIFNEIGINKLFDKMKADFSEGFDVNDNYNIYINKLKQKIYLDVNETGSEATAITTSKQRIAYTGALPESFVRTINLVFDRPFIYFIYDEQEKELLFMGYVRNLKNQ